MQDGCSSRPPRRCAGSGTRSRPTTLATPSKARRGSRSDDSGRWRSRRESEPTSAGHAGDFDVIDALQACAPFTKEDLGFDGLLVTRSTGLHPLYDAYTTYETGALARSNPRLGEGPAAAALEPPPDRLGERARLRDERS